MSDVRCEQSADAVGWVLGALSPEEAERFAAHLDSCATCRAEVATLTEVAERLADAAPAAHPAARAARAADLHAESSLFNAARAGPHPAETVPLLRRLRRRRGGLLATVGTLAVVIAAIVLLTANHTPPHAGARTVIGRVTPRGGARARAVVQIGGTGRRSPSSTSPPRPARRVCQAWVVRRGSPATPTGALFSDALRRHANSLAFASQHHGVIVTAEPPRGSATPTLPPIVLVQRSARPSRIALKS